MNVFLIRLGCFSSFVVHTMSSLSLAGPAAACGLLLAFASTVAAVDPPPTARTFDSLTTGGTTYTNVTIVDIAKQHVSFRSAQGFATVRIADLEAEVQARLAGRAPAVVAASPEERAVVPFASKARGALKVHARSGKDSGPEAEDVDTDKAVDKAPGFHWSTRNFIGVGILGLGMLAYCAGQIWLIYTGFQTSVVWGLLVLLGSFVASTIFCAGHWDAARRPAYMKMVGLAIAYGGWNLFTR